VSSSTFSIQPVNELDSVGINIADDDVLFNLVTKDTQLMKGSTPWRGGREKDPLLLQLLIESTMQVGYIVLDCIASTTFDFYDGIFVFWIKQLFFMEVFCFITLYNTTFS
jgi:hypothetical protein